MALTFGELKEVCSQVSGSLYAKDSRYTDEVFFYYVHTETEDDEGEQLKIPVKEVWFDIDSYNEDEVVHETVKEICINLSDKHNDVSDAEDYMIVKVLYTDTLTDVIEAKIIGNDVYLITE